MHPQHPPHIPCIYIGSCARGRRRRDALGNGGTCGLVVLAEWRVSGGSLRRCSITVDPMERAIGAANCLLHSRQREVQFFDAPALGCLTATIVAGGGHHTGVAGQLLGCREIDAGVQEVADKRAPEVVRG